MHNERIFCIVQTRPMHSACILETKQESTLRRKTFATYPLDVGQESAKEEKNHKQKH